MNQDSSLWCRLKKDFGPISGWHTTDQLVQYLNRYDFEITGKYQFLDIKEFNDFILRGAL
jgi:hypothetical protein